jgi:hypothetical protein
MERRYEIQIMHRADEAKHFRITDTIGDNRVATCFVPDNAQLVVDALNAFHGSEVQKQIEHLRLVMRQIRDVAQMRGDAHVHALATAALLPTLVP